MIEQLFPGGSQGDTVADDEKVKVSANDTTAGYLNGKLVAGSNVTFTEGSDGGDETLTIAAAGGVTGFTGSQNTSSPNDTVNASRLLVDATSTNADFVAQPKGTGALLAQLPDGTTTGGNKRGANAIDLQTLRVDQTWVASGVRSVVLGSYCKSTGTGSTAIGNRGTASGQNSFAVGCVTYSPGNLNAVASGIGSVSIGSGSVGRSFTASGDYSSAFGGIGNQATGYASTVIGGNNNTASGSSSFSCGVFNESTGVGAITMGAQAKATQQWQIAYASEAFNAAGDCQRETYVQRRSTTDATQTELSISGAAPAAATRMAIASDATYTFSGLVTARRTDVDDESAGWEIKGVIDNNAGTTALVGSVTVTALGDDSSGTWLVAVEADNTNDALVIKVTGEAAKTIRWGATVTLMKVAG